MDQSLFTKEALANQANAGFGNRRIILPPGLIFVSLLLAFIVLTALYFLTAQPYLRTTSVQGYLHADITRLAAERSGTLMEVMVEEGQIVAKGAPLALIYSQALRQGKDEHSYAALLAATERQVTQLKQIHGKEFDQLATSKKRLFQSNIRLKNIQIIQLKRIATLKQLINSAKSLLTGGFLSQLDWSKFQDQLLSSQQKLEEITGQLEENVGQISSLDIKKERSAARHKLEIIKIEQQKINLQQARDNWLANTQQILMAPAAGKITAIFKQPGDVVALKESILALSAIEKPLQARLLIPSHAVGFLQSGQKINILYDAFPHLKFGSYAGKLITVSRHTINRQDLPLEIPLEGRYYLATVMLTKQSVYAFGIKSELKPGMTLRADIELGKRTLIEWLLEPLLLAKDQYV